MEPVREKRDVAREFLDEARKRAKRARLDEAKGEDLPAPTMRRAEDEEEVLPTDAVEQHEELLGESPPSTLPSPHSSNMGESPPPISTVEDDCRVSTGCIGCIVAQGMLPPKLNLSAAAA